MKLCAVCYDITSDKRRRNVEKILGGYGTRAQYSVFECLINDKQYRELEIKLKDSFMHNKKPEDMNDSIIIYKICSNCQTGIVVMGNRKGIGNYINSQTVTL